MTLVGVGGGGVWTPQSLGPALRAWWRRDLARDASAGALGAGENLGSWLDATGDWPAGVIHGTAPTGAVSAGGPVVVAFGGSGAAGTTPAAIPDDVAGTVAAVVRVPANVAARDFDAVVCFSRSDTSNVQSLLGLRRVGGVLYFGATTQNASAQISQWYGSTTALTSGSWTRVIWRFTGSALAIRVDGVVQTITEIAATGPSVGQWLGTITSVDKITIGGRIWSSGLGEAWTDQIAEVCWSSQALGDGDLTRLDGYLASVQDAVS